MIYFLFSEANIPNILLFRNYPNAPKHLHITDINLYSNHGILIEYELAQASNKYLINSNLDHSRIQFEYDTLKIVGSWMIRLLTRFP